MEEENSRGFVYINVTKVLLTSSFYLHFKLEKHFFSTVELKTNLKQTIHSRRFTS